MPHIDKPSWIHHDGKAVNSIDVSSDGARLATAGSNGKVRIWTMQAVLNHHAEQDKSLPKKLATLTDHTESDINSVRFSPDGTYLASAGDDQAVFLYKLLPGRGGTSFGAGEEGPNIENWKISKAFRRHKLGVTGLAWSPDSALLASCSLDTDVMIWDAVEGHAVAVLPAHDSFVKGVAWDPVGSYVASFGEDLTVCVWSTTNWSCVAKIEENLEHMSTRTLFCRLSFSALGDQLAIVNSNDGDLCTLMLCNREQWGNSVQLVGHEGTVVTSRYSPCVFSAPEGAQNDKRSGAHGEGDVARQYLAAGSQDKSVSIWPQGESKPLLVMRRAFKASVSDLAWSPDGLTLLAASLDGTVASVTFTNAELGTALSHDKVDLLFRDLYGNTSTRHDQLLEGAEALAGPSRRVGAAGSAVIAGGRGSATAQPPSHPDRARADAGDGAAPSANIRDGAVRKGLSARLDPAAEGAPGAVSESLAQNAGGQKRSHPGDGATAAAAKRPRVADMLPPAPRPVAAVAAPVAAAPAAAAGATAASAHHVSPLLPLPAVQTELSIEIPSSDSPTAADPDSVPERIVLAANSMRSSANSRSRAAAQITCTVGGRLLWATCVHSPVTLLAGGPGWVAAALQDASLVVLSASGRRMLPHLVMQAPIALLSSARAGQLVALLSNGTAKVWNVLQRKAVLHCDARAVVRASPSPVVAISLTTSGLPCLTLANAHAYAYHIEMQEWMRVADWGFPASAHHSVMSGGAAGEISSLLAAAEAQRPRAAIFDAMQVSTQQQEMDSCAHLESCMAAAEAAGCPHDWSNWLVQYVQLLTRQGDAQRLSHLCQELLGPPSWRPSGAAAGAAAARAALDAGLDAHAPSADGTTGVTPGAEAGQWHSHLLGLSKREMLERVVLPIIMSVASLSKIAIDFSERLAAARRHSSDIAEGTR